MSAPATPEVRQGERAHGGLWSRPYRSLTVGLLLSALVAAFEQLSVATVLPAASQELNGLSLYSWVFSGFMLAMVISLPVGGGQVDRAGPWRPYLSGATLFGAGLGIAGLAPTMPVVVGGRILQGFGAGFIASVLYATIGRAYPEHTRPRMLALISSAYTLPSVVGPALAGFIAEYAGWRWVFLGLMPLLPLSALACGTAMRRLERRSTQRQDGTRVVQAVRLAAGVAVTTASFERLSLGAGVSWPSVVAAALAVAGAGAAISALRALQPRVRGEAGPLSAAVYTAVLLNMAFFGIDAFLPLSLVELRSFPLSMAGLVLTAATVSWVVGAWVQARLTLRHSPRALASAGLTLIGAGIIGVVAVLTFEPPAFALFLAWAVAGFGMGLASPTVTLTGMALAPLGQEGAGTSVITLAGILGIAVGTGLGGTLIGAAGGEGTIARSGVAIHGLLMAGGLLVALVGWVRRFPSRAQPGTALPKGADAGIHDAVRPRPAGG